MTISNPLTKYNKLKRFAGYISERIRETVYCNSPDTPITLTSAHNPLKDAIESINCLDEDIYTQRDIYEKLDAIAECANIVEIRKYDTGEIKIHNANWCHNPVVCAVCADRVSKRRKVIFSDPIKRAVRRYAVSPDSGDWRQEYPAGYTGVYLATATIKDGPKLKNRIDTLLESIKRMRKKGQRRIFGKSRSSGEWSKVKAGISNIEIKIGSGSNEWHVHAHFLLFTDSPIDIRVKDSIYSVSIGGEKCNVSKFNHEWFESTGGEGINFDLRPIQYQQIVSGRECKTFEESVEAQAGEVIKYSTMLSGKKGLGLLSANQYIELIQRRGNRRLFNSIGNLRCDKRNPESLMTVSERELRRLEYIDSVDNKCYEVYAAQWQNGGTYSDLTKQDGAIFKDSDDKTTRYKNVRRRAFMAQTAMYQGVYRKERNNFLRERHLYNDKENYEKILNESRDIFRNRVSELWRRFGDMDFIPDFLREFDCGGMEEFRKKCLNFTPVFLLGGQNG